MPLLKKPQTVEQAVDFIKAVTLEQTHEGIHPQFADLIEALLGRSLSTIEKEIAIDMWLMGLLP